jgi:hypothetical protein
MTFTIVSVSDATERVVATVWAEAQAEAEAFASSLFPGSERAVRVRRAEDREIPMRMAAEPSYTSPHLS